jgi:hypothetical protein
MEWLLLSKALGQVPPRYAAMSLMVVVARGTLDQGRCDIDASLSMHLGAVQ